MIKVTLVYPRALNEPQGLSKVICMFNESRSIFKKHGVDLCLISRDTIVGKEISYYQGRISVYPSLISILRRYLMDFLDKGAKKWRFLAQYVYKKSIFGWSQKAVSFFMEKNDNSDVLLFHDIYTCAEYLHRRKERKTKVICMVHSIGIPLFGLEQQYPHLIGTKFYRKLEHLENFVMDNVDAYGFVSNSSLENFKDSRPNYNQEKLFYIHNGMPDISSNNIRTQGFLEIICVGSICFHKGQWRIIDALIELNNNKDLPDNIHFTFIGSGEMKSDIEEKISNNHLKRYINLVGQINNVDDYLLNSSIFILPTSNDGLPMAIIEAMRASLPIVSTKVGGIPELIDDKVSGIFIEPSKEGIMTFIKGINNYNWAEMGKNSRAKYLQEFTVEAMVTNYCRIIKKTIDHE
ncbi:glycosyltransferase family 4 protein [Bacteroides cutis]|jgi:glycosyltransferase involved in cell wall biosynthesis|uniref:glycosyltransferase family 4 protein n=1 Tax=Bacteroides cutis TaxID=2024197 RepID=UPI0023A8CD4D|nr:glycosyltransferase family 4 protein [Bacteroides cutis]